MQTALKMLNVDQTAVKITLWDGRTLNAVVWRSAKTPFDTIEQLDAKLAADGVACNKASRR